MDDKYLYLNMCCKLYILKVLILLIFLQAKSSSLGRTGVSLTSSSSRSWSSKDLLALAGPAAEANKPRIQIATEKLHELFIALRALEARENSEPYQPDAFLQALRCDISLLEGDLFCVCIIFSNIIERSIRYLREISNRTLMSF